MKNLCTYILGLFILSLILKFTNDFLQNHVGLNVLQAGKGSKGTLLGKYGVFAFPLVALVIPLIEEFIFRLPLINTKKNRSIAFITLTTFLTGTILLNTNIVQQWKPYTVFMICPILFLIACLFFQRKDNPLVSQILFWLSVVLFGLAHVSNFIPFQPQYIIIYAIFVSPQALAGYFLAKIRLRLGILYSVLFHIAINIPASLVLLHQASL